jgi:hypothetical protein
VLLAALVIMAVAAVLAATSVAAVIARQGVAAADRSATRAEALERRAVAIACLEARRGGWSNDGGSIAATPGDGEHWRVTWSPVSDEAGAAWTRFAVTVDATCGDARRALDAVVELRQEPFACGPVVSGDAEFAAPVALSGSGLYCGGSVRGREWLSFTPVDGVPAADGVHGDLWPRAAVHALGGIWARGVEEHGDDPSAAPDDTDTHTAANEVLRAVSAPSADWLETLGSWADDPGDALVDGVLRLDRIPPVRGDADGRPPDAGFIFWLPPCDPPVRVVGVRPPGWCPVLIVAGSDLVLGEPSADTCFTGAAVTVGHLEIGGETSIGGSVYAGSLRVAHAFALTVPSLWRSRPIAGLALPVMLARDISTVAGK